MPYCTAACAPYQRKIIVIRRFGEKQPSSALKAGCSEGKHREIEPDLVVIVEQRVNVLLKADGRRAVDHIIYLPSQPSPAQHMERFHNSTLCSYSPVWPPSLNASYSVCKICCRCCSCRSCQAFTSTFLSSPYRHIISIPLVSCCASGARSFPSCRLHPYCLSSTSV